MEYIIIVLLVVIIVILLTNKLKPTTAAFKMYQVQIGMVETVTAADEKALIVHKEALRLMKKRIDMNIAGIADSFNDMSLSGEGLKRLQGKFDALLSVQRDINYLIHREVE